MEADHRSVRGADPREVEARGAGQLMAGGGALVLPKVADILVTTVVITGALP